MVGICLLWTAWKKKWKNVCCCCCCCFFWGVVVCFFNWGTPMFNLLGTSDLSRQHISLVGSLASQLKMLVLRKTMAQGKCLKQKQLQRWCCTCPNTLAIWRLGILSGNLHSPWSWCELHWMTLFAQLHQCSTPEGRLGTVSYTHLTLPTNAEV